MSEPTTAPPDPPPIDDAQQIAFWFPYAYPDFEEESIRDIVVLIAVMLRNGAGIIELQQRIMGLG